MRLTTAYNKPAVPPADAFSPDWPAPPRALSVAQPYIVHGLFCRNTSARYAAESTLPRLPRESLRARNNPQPVYRWQIPPRSRSIPKESLDPDPPPFFGRDP